MLSSVSFSFDLDILDFFQTVPIPFLPFLPMRPRTCWGLNHPLLCPKSILYLYYLILGHNLPRLGPWALMNKWAKATNYWAPQYIYIYIYIYYLLKECNKYVCFRMRKMIYSFFFSYIIFCQYYEAKFVSFASNLRGFEFVIFFFFCKICHYFKFLVI